MPACRDAFGAVVRVAPHAAPRRLTWYVALVVASGMGMALPSGARSQPQPLPTGLRAWLDAIEAVPDASALHRAGGPGVARWLDQVAHDAGAGSYARHRAVSFLGLLPDADATARLRAHLRNVDVELRSTAALTWLAGPGRRKPAMAEPHVAALLTDPAPSVRASAARGLAWFGDPSTADRWLAKRLAVETEPSVRTALEAAQRARIRARAR